MKMWLQIIAGSLIGIAIAAALIYAIVQLSAYMVERS